MTPIPTVRKIALGLLALSAMLSVSTLQAEDAAPKKEKGPSKAELKKYDANGDGQLDETEIAKMKADEKAKREEKRTEDLAKYDENKDSKINKAEKEKMKADHEAARAGARATAE